MQAMFAMQIRGPGRTVDRIAALPVVDPTQIAHSLSAELDPYLVTAAIAELAGEGLFSNVSEWHKMADGTYSAGQYVRQGLCYTEFAAKFAKFISAPGSSL
jgi:hypothetical protein